MTTLQATILGAIQGLTEFLPVSSSGHLVICQYFFGLKEPELLFDTAVHFGTLIAVCVVFRGDIANISRAVFISRKEGDLSLRLLFLIILGLIPTALIGLGFKGLFEKLFGMLIPTASMLMVTGVLLFLADRMGERSKDVLGMKALDAISVGIVQGLAIIPGISRSGSTIATGLFRGLERNFSARFSFLLSIPAILGAGLVQIPDLKGVEEAQTFPLIVGTVVSAVTGYMAIKTLLKVVARKRLSVFSYYCWAVGLVAISLG